MNKKVVAVLFGGRSSEHEISKISAFTVISHINKDKYYVIPIYITKEGKWLIYDGPTEALTSNGWEKFATTAVLSPDTEHKGILRIVGDRVKVMPVDVVFPVLHGAYGEDGTVQGLLELASIPYVGCGVYASAAGMNKAYTKLVAASTGVKQADHTVIYKYELENDIDSCIARIEEKCGYPCFIKPACAGSSVGITKAHNPGELADGLWIAAKEDTTIVVERAIIGRELETAVLGNTDIQAGAVGEIIAAAEFYDYDAKYNNSASKTIVPADIPTEKADEIRSYAIKIFKALGGKGLARVDFFLEEGTNNVIFNEINTLPGFTSISMYPMLFNEVGIDIDTLVDKLIELGLSRYDD